MCCAAASIAAASSCACKLLGSSASICSKTAHPCSLSVSGGGSLHGHRQHSLVSLPLHCSKQKTPALHNAPLGKQDHSSADLSTLKTYGSTCANDVYN